MYLHDGLRCFHHYSSTSNYDTSISFFLPSLLSLFHFPPLFPSFFFFQFENQAVTQWSEVALYRTIWYSDLTISLAFLGKFLAMCTPCFWLFSIFLALVFYVISFNFHSFLVSLNNIMLHFVCYCFRLYSQLFLSNYNLSLTLELSIAH
jgi:hypothetical protein